MVERMHQLHIFAPLMPLEFNPEHLDIIIIIMWLDLHKEEGKLSFCEEHVFSKEALLTLANCLSQKI
jgi:hypothetical protein